MKIDNKIKEEWENLKVDAHLFEYDSFRLTLEKTIDYVERELFEILYPSKKTSEDKYLDPNLGVKESLKKISSNPNLKSQFETLLKKNYNIANWFFWLEVKSLIEQKREDEEILHKIQEITQKYLLESSFDEVTKFFF